MFRHVYGQLKVLPELLSALARILMTGNSITIPERTVHRLIGMEGVPQAVVLEISFGEFDEADIVRLEDDYARIPKAATAT